MKQCVLIILEGGSLYRLSTADKLDHLLTLEIPLVVLDCTYDMAIEPVKQVIDANRPPFIVEMTQLWQEERAKLGTGEVPLKHGSELAMQQFMIADDGLKKIHQDVRKGCLSPREQQTSRH